MSHVASLAAVVLLALSNIFLVVSHLSPWWSYSKAVDEATFGKGSTKDVGLWNFKAKSGTSGMFTDVTWDDMCDNPSAKDELGSSGTCMKIKAGRALLVISGVFAGLSSAGNLAGAYTGNTLIDSAAGVISAFGSVFCLLGIFVCNMASSEGGFFDNIGFKMAFVSQQMQFWGAILGCVGTCQEIRETTRLAASLHLGAYKEEGKKKSRSEKAAAIRAVEEGEAKEIYENLQKRKKAAEDALARQSDPNAPSPEKEPDKKKVPVMLQRVLFRKPQEGDDDEIPTKMLEDAFAEIDGDGSGSIELDELVDALKLCGLAVSKNATDTIMKEIDKNASGDVDLREFIEFFRHIEDLNRFQKKTAARQQFVTLLLNFCFLADIIVVGVMLMMFIRMEEAENPDNYSIMKNVLLACSFLLGVLFLLVILLPILRLALGPSVNKMQKQYELAQEIKKSQRKKMDTGEEEDTGPRQAGYTADDAPPPVNAAMFGRSYRPGKVDSTAWTPAIEDSLLTNNKSATVVQAGNRPGTQGSHDQQGRAGTNQTPGSAGGEADNKAKTAIENHQHSHGRRSWRYDPQNYSIATEHAYMLQMNGLGPTSWTPMQVSDVNIPKQTGPAVLPGAPLALTDAAFPQPQGYQRN